MMQNLGVCYSILADLHPFTVPCVLDSGFLLPASVHGAVPEVAVAAPPRLAQPPLLALVDCPTKHPGAGLHSETAAKSLA